MYEYSNYPVMAACVAKSKGRPLTWKLAEPTTEPWPPRATFKALSANTTVKVGRNNFPRLNEDIVWPCSCCHGPELGAVIRPCQATRQKKTLEVIFALWFDKQINSVVKSSFLQSRIISPISPCLSYIAPLSSWLLWDIDYSNIY